MIIDKKFNVLWICTDQQRFDTLGCYGNNFVDTPNIDRLAKMGMLFDNCYSQSPICTPSRASFLTGRYPRTTRCRQNGQKIPDDEKLVTKILAENDYICGLSGKLHLAPCHPSVCKGMEERIDDGYHVFHWSHGGHDGWATHEYFQWLRGQDKKFETNKLSDCKYVSYGMDEEYHQTKWCVDKAIDFIQANNEYDNNWCFSVNIFDPHHPFDPPKKYLDKYMDELDKIPLSNYVEGELESKPSSKQKEHRGASNNPGHFDYETFTDRDHRLVKASYWAMVELIDHQIGRILDLLETTGELDRDYCITQ